MVYKEITMKKIVSFITVIAMLAVSTPALANHNRDYRWGNDRNVYSPYYGQQRINSRNVVIRDRRNRGVSTEGAIIIGLGALLVGSAIANDNNRRRNNNVVVIDRQQQRAPQGCQDIIQYDYYGNPYIADRRCWYNR
jgi:hypothetical protein